MTILRCQWLYLRMNMANVFTSRPCLTNCPIFLNLQILQNFQSQIWPWYTHRRIIHRRQSFPLCEVHFGQKLVVTKDRGLIARRRCNFVLASRFNRSAGNDQGLHRQISQRIVLRVFKGTIQDSIDQGMAIASVFASNCCNLRFRNNWL